MPPTKKRRIKSDSGFIHLKNIFVPTDSIKSKIIQIANKGGEAIFNHNQNAKNDRKRTQTRLRNSDQDICDFKTMVEDKVQKYVPNLEPNNWVILKSKPGCQEQMPHCDYEPDKDWENASDNNVPYGAIVAIMPGSKIKIWEKSFFHNKNTNQKQIKPIEGRIVELDPGDVFLFRGDLVHAGAVYQEINYRLHFYLDSPKIIRNPNRTYTINKDEFLKKIII